MKLKEWLYNRRNPLKMNDKELQRIEARLQDTFSFQKPKTQYIQKLREDLLRKFPNIETTLSEPKPPAIQTGLLVAGGVLGSIFVFLTGIRGLVSLIGVGGLIISIIKQNAEESYTATDLTS